MVTAGLALLGVSLFVVILGLAATAAAEGRVSVSSRNLRIRRALMNYGYFIVCVYGRAGRAIARELETGARRSTSWTAKPN